ncbi:MAG: ABC transporter substrate-binding protein [Chloroflexi bacterium]|nr:ABC transporter substrate-binding protein [Chloroflexota bacterium]
MNCRPVLLMIVFLLVFIAGCAPAPAPAPIPITAPTSSPMSAPQASATPAATAPAPIVATAPAPTPTAATGARQGGTIVIGVTADPGQFNIGITTAGGTHAVADSLYNGLLQFDEKLDPQPSLAESWTISSDGKAYTFKLVPGVQWHDGQPLTSADVKFTFEQVLLKFHARTSAGLSPVLDGIDTPDATTVVFRFKQPYPPFLRRLDVVEAPILPKHIYDGTDVQKNPANDKPIGSGAFKFKEYVKGDHITFVRNENYFKKGLPYADQIIFKIIPQATTATLALERGEIDYLGGVPGPDVERLQKNSDIALVRAPAGPGGSFCIETLIFNMRKPPFDKLETRQAFAYGINRQQLLNQVQFGQGRIATGPIASTMSWAYNPNVTKYAYDKAMAEKLLDQAGFSKGADGKRLKVVFVHATGFAKTAEVVRENMSQVGVEVQLDTLEVNAANDRMFTKNDFDLGIGSYCNGPDPEIGVTRAYVSSNIKVGVPFSNGAAYRNARVDQLFEQAAATIDTAQRTKLYAEIQDILVKEVPYWWTIETEGYRAHRKEINDLRYWAGDIYERAWTSKAR